MPIASPRYQRRAARGHAARRYARPEPAGTANIAVIATGHSGGHREHAGTPVFSPRPHSQRIQRPAAAAFQPSQASQARPASARNRRSNLGSEEGRERSWGATGRGQAQGFASTWPGTSSPLAAAENAPVVPLQKVDPRGMYWGLHVQKPVRKKVYDQTVSDLRLSCPQPPFGITAENMQLDQMATPTTEPPPRAYPSGQVKQFMRGRGLGGLRANEGPLRIGGQVDTHSTQSVVLRHASCPFGVVAGVATSTSSARRRN